MENSRKQGKKIRRYLAREFGSRYRSPIPSASSNSRRPQQETTATVSSEKMKDDETIQEFHGRVKELANNASNLSIMGENALLPSANALQKQNATPIMEENSADQTENPKPIETLNSRLLDQHRWPSATGGKQTTSGSMNKATESPQESSNNALLLQPYDDNSLSLRIGSRPASPKKATRQSLFVTENSRSLNNLHSQLLDKWPGRIGRKVTSDSLNRVTGASDRNTGTTSSEGVKRGFSFHSVDDNSVSIQRAASRPTSPYKASIMPSSISKNSSSTDSEFHQRLSLDGGTKPLQNFPRSISPSRPSAPSSVSRGVSPSRTKAIASATSLLLGSEGPPSRRLSLDGGTKWIQNSSREIASLEGEKGGFGSHSLYPLPMQSAKTSLVNPETKSHHTSSNRASTPSTFSPFGVIPSKVKAISSGTSPILGSRRLSLDGANKPLQNLTSNHEHIEGGLGLHSFDDNSHTLQKERTRQMRSLPTSPKKASAVSSSVSGVVNPSKAKAIANATSLFFGSRALPLQRLSLDGLTKRLQKSSNESAKGSFEFHSVDDNSLSLPRERTSLANPGTKPRPISPNKASAFYFSQSRVTQTQTKAPSRGASPSKVRPSSPSRRPNPVFNFVTDIKENDANQSEEAHQLRLLHNRHLQWRYANAQANAAIHAEEVNTKEMAHNVWRTNVNLRGTIIQMRIELQQLRLEKKLHSILNEQMSCLDEWSSIERNHITSVSRASQDIQGCVLRLPLMGGARGNTQALKSAVCSAFVIMQYVESSICSMLSQLEGTSILVSELAGIVAQERAMLDEYELLMAPTADMQVEEHSLRANLMQLGTNLQ